MADIIPKECAFNQSEAAYSQVADWTGRIRDAHRISQQQQITRKAVFLSFDAHVSLVM